MGWHDAFDARIDLTAWYRTRFGQEWLAEHYRQNIGGYGDSTERLLAELGSAELTKLIDADPIYVTEEMCDLVAHARDSFQPEPLMPSDLLTAHGFLLWEKPFLMPDRDGRIVPTHAMSWSPIIGDRGRAATLPANPDELLRWFQEHDYGRLWQEAEETEARGEEPTAAFVDGIAITLYVTNQRDSEWNRVGPMVIPMHMTPWWFGMSFAGNDLDEAGRPTGASQWWRVAQTTLRLMQQRIAVPWRERPMRAARRRGARDGFADRDVVVVRLRREKRKPGDEAAQPANYSHRFIVNGHWRNQWYPSERTHRQIWISPYEKGPEGAPLIWRPNRVYNWGR